MLSREEFIQLSLELNVFFARIAKEHSIFIAGAFTVKDYNLAVEADNFKVQFEMLLAETITLSNGFISPEVIRANELITPYTLDAERTSAYLSGIPINSSITRAESQLEGVSPSASMPIRTLEEAVFMLNEKAMALTCQLAQFKAKLLSDVLACRIFTNNYPLLLDHILREAKFYLRMIGRLQNRERLDSSKDLLEQEVFWNRIMAEHSKFIRGLLDPTEEQLFNTANNFGKQFDELTREAIAATEQTIPLEKVTDDSLKAAKELSDFKATGTKGLIACNIRSIAYPLLGDHVLREANHYIRILNQFKSGGMLK